MIEIAEQMPKMLEVVEQSEKITFINPSHTCPIVVPRVSVCVCACVGVCVRACVRACVCGTWVHWWLSGIHSELPIERLVVQGPASGNLVLSFSLSSRSCSDNLAPPNQLTQL